MAHEVETMMYTVDEFGRGVPWHGLGTRVAGEAPDTERALVLGGLNWAVQLMPTPHPVFPGQVVDGSFCNVRVTDGKVLGVVGSKYRPVQNRELAHLIDGLIGEGGAQIETCGSITGGARVWLAARMPEQYRLAGDPVVTYLMVTNFHNGAGPVRANVVPIRPVCRNTINLALTKSLRSWTCRHTGNVTGKVNEAARALGMARTYMAELEEKADILAQTPVSPDRWSEIVAQLIELPKDTKTPGTVDRAKARQKVLWSKMLTPDLKTFKWTGWGAINAVSDFVGHEEPARKAASWQESRMAQMVDGHPLLDKALALLG